MLPVADRRLGTNVDESRDAGSNRPVQHGACAQHIYLVPGIFRTPGLDKGGAMQNGLAIANIVRRDRLQVTADRLGPQRPDPAIRPVRPRHRPQLMSVRHQRARRCATDKARCPGDEYPHGKLSSQLFYCASYKTISGGSWQQSMPPHGPSDQSGTGGSTARRGVLLSPHPSADRICINSALQTSEFG